MRSLRWSVVPVHCYVAVASPKLAICQLLASLAGLIDNSLILSVTFEDLRDNGQFCIARIE